ncbi:MAG TPA: peroxiredoxin [Chthoniobacterales bacterium]
MLDGVFLPSLIRQNHSKHIVWLCFAWVFPDRFFYLLNAFLFFPRLIEHNSEVKADTPGCTAEACSLRDSYDDLRAKGLQIIGVSEDQADAQKKFQEKYKLPFSVVADADGSVAKAFGVPVVAGFAKRQSFLIKDKKIAWLDLNASTRNQAADIRQALAKLESK